MAISIRKSWSAIAVIFAALLMGSLSSAAFMSQVPGQPPNSEAERKKLLDRLTRQVQETQQGAKQLPGAPVQQPQPNLPATAPVQNPPAANPPIVASAQRNGGRMQLSYENADLYDFINQIASALGLTPLVIDSEVKGSVNIMSSSPMSKEDVLPLFNLILKNNNAALIKQGDVYQIVPISSALKRGVEIIEHLPSESPSKPESEKLLEKKPETPSTGTGNQTSRDPLLMKMRDIAAARTTSKMPPSSSSSNRPEPEASESDRLATHVIHVEFVPVKDLIEPLKLFMTEGGVIMPYERLNMLIITDYTDSAERILQVIRMLDNSYLDPDLVDLVKINHNASADVAEDLKKIFGTGAKDSATGVSFVSLDRLNAIFVMASSKRALEEAKRWIKELDASSGRNIQTYVYVVENSTASNIAMMLSALYGGEGSIDSTSAGAGAGPGYGGTAGGGRGSQFGGTQGSQFGGSGSTFGAGQTGAAGGPFANQSALQGTQPYNSGGYSGGGYTGGYMGGSAFGASRQLGPQLNVSRTVTSQVLRGGAFTGLQDTVRLVVDDINNSLIIQATAADYAYISETIKKMDVLPRQAIIDARIFEVDLTDNLTFGVNAALQAKSDGSNGEHLTTASIDPSAGALSASTFAFVGNSRQILAALNALRLKTKVRILEAPSVLALDGMMAQIVVGAEIPYPGTSFTPSVGGSTTSVQYRDTGISLIVMPRISASGSVTLDIAQEVSAPGASVPIGDGGSAPSFAKTSVNTTLSVKDGETVAIAGLIRDGNDFSRSGVPFFSQIPILGSLFGRTTRNSHRSELIILITPHVIRTPEKMEEMTQELRDSLRHVRTYADEKEQERVDDMEDARKERYEQEQKRLKKR
jgi:general secretion pathway protein D